MRDFGSMLHPLRCSALPLLVACPLRAMLFAQNLADDLSGKAADTGSVVHAGIHYWHKHDQDYSASVAAMRESLALFPLADLNDAELHFRPYTKDPENINAEILASEEKVLFSLQAASFDPTGEDIVLRGTLDQIRYQGGHTRIFDVKTGKRMDASQMLSHYVLQIAAYSIGATKLLGRTVEPGALIRTYGYRSRTQKGVFLEYSLSTLDCNSLMRSVQNNVALIRMGQAHAGPGDHCSYCAFAPLSECLPRTPLVVLA